jgi:hypothetical protein
MAKLRDFWSIRHAAKYALQLVAYAGAAWVSIIVHMYGMLQADPSTHRAGQEIVLHR